MNIILNIIWLLFIISVIFLENKNPGEALFWMVIIVTTRYVGIVLYVLFGSTLSIKLTMFVRRQRFTTEWRKHAYKSISNTYPDCPTNFSRVNSRVINFNSGYNAITSSILMEFPITNSFLRIFPRPPKVSIFCFIPYTMTKPVANW